MTARLNILETDNSINRGGGTVWNRLHSEREDICEALLKESEPGSGSSPRSSAPSKEEAARKTLWHRELLQSRLRKIDDALDRLMSGSYGNCCKCGRWIEDTKLELDPAIAFCLECWGHQLKRLGSERSAVESRQNTCQVNLTPSLVDHSTDPFNTGVAIETLAPFDTIRVRTLNSEYRIFLLDPKTGRAIVQGGSHFVEPVDAVVNGSVGPDSIPKVGWIGIGCRLEMMINMGIVSISPVQSFDVDRQFANESESVASFVM